MQVIWFAALLAAIMARPATADGLPLTLGECVHAALTQSPDLAAAVADIALAEARIKEAEAAQWGEIGYTQILGFVNEARGDVTTTTSKTTDYFDGLGAFTRLDLHMAIPLITFGKLRAGLEAARLGLASEQAHGVERRAVIVTSTKELYYGLLLARQLSLVLSDMQETMDKAVATTEKRLRDKVAGVTQLDLLKLKVGRARFNKGAAELTAATTLARSALARAVGRAGDSTFEIADQKLRPVEATIEPLDVYLARGLAGRPEWERVDAGVAAQEQKVKIAQADYYPRFFFGGGLQFARAGNRTEQTNPFVYDDFNYLRPGGVVGMNWDLSFFSTQAKVDQARAELARLRAQQREAETGLPLALERAYVELTRAKAAMAAAEDGRKAGRGLLVLTLANFDLAIGSAEELFNGLGAYTESSSDYFQAVHDYNVAVAGLSRIVGEVTDLKY